MIKLQSSSPPSQLTPEFISRGVQEYKDAGSAVWNVQFIKDAVLAKSHAKCCYCEANIQEESKYLEVDHFHPKTIYQDEVLNWENLLPSCKRCNTTKGDLDTKTNFIINPEVESPKDHLYFNGYRLYEKTSLGRSSIDNLNLNCRKRLVDKRYKVGIAIIENLESILELSIDFDTGVSRSTRRKNSIIEKLTNIMSEGLPGSEYSAIVSTIIVSESSFEKIKEIFERNLLWNSELDNILANLISSALLQD